MIEPPEPFASALRRGRTRDAMDAPATTAEELLARGRVRAREGKHEIARTDLEAARRAFSTTSPELHDLCIAELLYLDRRWGLRPLDVVIRDLHELSRRSESLSYARARALHELGYAEGKRRQNQRSLELLLRARDLYLQLGDTALAGQVRDTLGTLYSSQGNYPEALTQYALSIVSKTANDDQYGIALTLGSMALLLIQIERFDDAASCARENLRISEELENSVGIVAAQTRLGAALLGIHRFEAAGESLHSAMHRLKQDQRLGGHDEMYVRKELARLELANGDLARASEHLEHARGLLPDRPEPYPLLLLDTVAAELLLARGDEQGLAALEECADRAGNLRFPAVAVRLLIDVARRNHGIAEFSRARDALDQANDLTRWPGCELFRTTIREAFAELFAESTAVPFSANEPPRIQGHADQPSRFLKFAQLGQGGFATVYHAYDLQHDEYIALKEFELGDEYDTQERTRIHRSARTELLATSKVVNPGVARARALDFEPKTGNLQLVQDYIVGPTLRLHIDTEPFEAFPFLEVAKKLGYALAAVHDAGIVHRDLKPDNILLRANEFDPVIVDFGVATIRDEIARKTTLGRGGTNRYMCNEQRRGETPTPQWDIFALGVSLYEWCVGGLPEDLLRPEPLRASLVQKAMPDKLAAVPNLPEAARELICRLLSLDRTERPGAHQFARECERIMESERQALLGG